MLARAHICKDRRSLRLQRKFCLYFLNSVFHTSGHHGGFKHITSNRQTSFLLWVKDPNLRTYIFALPAYQLTHRVGKKKNFLAGFLDGLSFPSYCAGTSRLVAGKLSTSQVYLINKAMVVRTDYFKCRRGLTEWESSQVCARSEHQAIYKGCSKAEPQMKKVIEENQNSPSGWVRELSVSSDLQSSNWQFLTKQALLWKV